MKSSKNSSLLASLMILVVIAVAASLSGASVFAQNTNRSPVSVPTVTAPRDIGAPAVTITNGRVDVSGSTSGQPTGQPSSLAQPIPRFYPAINAPVWLTEPSGSSVQIVNDVILHGLTDLRGGLINGPIATGTAPLDQIINIFPGNPTPPPAAALPPPPPPPAATPPPAITQAATVAASREANEPTLIYQGASGQVLYQFGFRPLTGQDSIRGFNLSVLNPTPSARASDLSLGNYELQKYAGFLLGNAANNWQITEIWNPVPGATIRMTSPWNSINVSGINESLPQNGSTFRLVARFDCERPLRLTNFDVGLNAASVVFNNPASTITMNPQVSRVKGVSPCINVNRAFIEESTILQASNPLDVSPIPTQVPFAFQATPVFGSGEITADVVAARFKVTPSNLSGAALDSLGSVAYALEREQAPGSRSWTVLPLVSQVNRTDPQNIYLEFYPVPFTGRGTPPGVTNLMQSTGTRYRVTTRLMPCGLARPTPIRFDLTIAQPSDITFGTLVQGTTAGVIINNYGSIQSNIRQVQDVTCNFNVLNTEDDSPSLIGSFFENVFGGFLETANAQSGGLSSGTTIQQGSGLAGATPVTIFDDLLVSGNTTDQGNLVARGAISAASFMVSGQVTTGDLVVNGSLTITQPTQFTGGLTVIGGDFNAQNANFAGTLTVGTAQVPSTLTVNGRVTANQIGRFYPAQGDSIVVNSSRWSEISTASCDSDDVMLSCVANVPDRDVPEGIETSTTSNDRCSVRARLSESSFSGFGTTPARDTTVQAWSMCFSPNG